MDIEVHEAHRSPYRFNSKMTSPKHIIIKLSKIRYKDNFESSEKKKKTSSHTKEPP